MANPRVTAVSINPSKDPCYPFAANRCVPEAFPFRQDSGTHRREVVLSAATLLNLGAEIADNLQTRHVHEDQSNAEERVSMYHRQHNATKGGSDY